MWKPSIWISYEHPMESAGSLYIFLFFSQTLRMLRWDMVTLTRDLDMPWPASKKDWKQIGLQLQVTNHLWISTWHDVNLRDLPILAQCSQPQNWLSDENVDVPWCHDGAMMVPNSAPKFLRIETWYDLIPIRRYRRKRCGMTLGNLHRRQQMLEATRMLFLIGLAVAENQRIKRNNPMPFLRM